MTDEIINNNLELYRTHLNQSNLPKDEADRIFTDYKTQIVDKVQSVKQGGASPQETVSTLKSFSSGVAQNKLADEHTALAQYYLEDLVHGSTLTNVDTFYWDTFANNN
jgi:hypothetical protein